jgi:hypothetical protein
VVRRAGGFESRWATTSRRWQAERGWRHASSFGRLGAGRPSIGDGWLLLQLAMHRAASSFKATAAHGQGLLQAAMVAAGGQQRRVGGHDWHLWVWPSARVDKFHLTYNDRMWAVID